MSLEPLNLILLQYPWIVNLLKVVAVLLAGFLLLIIIRNYLLKWLAKLAKKSKTTLDDILLRKAVFHRLAYFVPAIIIYHFAYLFGSFEAFVKRIVIAFVIWIFLLVIDAILTAVSEILDEVKHEKLVNLKSYFQITKIILFIVGAILIIATLIGQSPIVLLSGFGALTAVLLLVFRDTILSFVASLQISSYDLVKVGDWIEAPKYGADGDVIDIALHTVKVQNWDKTITVVPTHKLIEETFKNWRGMSEAGGRRIKRAIHIDMTTIKLCDKKLLDRFKRFHLIKEYLETKEKEVESYNLEHNADLSELINGRRLTNVGTFRAYITAYLRNHPKIRNDMTFLIRQLNPGPNGLPIEIYVFANDIRWANYEGIQSDIFDHILSVIPMFDLRVFQSPSGNDFQRLSDLSAWKELK